MAKKQKKRAGKTPKLNKRNLWLKHFLDETNRETFLKKAASARAAQYLCKDAKGFAEIGCQNFNFFKKKIKKYMDENGLSEEAVKIKLLSLMNSKRTIFHKIKGHFDLKDPGPNVVILGETHKMEWQGKDEDAQAFDDGETLLGVNVDALDIQARMVTLAVEIHGMKAPEKHEHSGKGGGPIEHTHKADPMSLAALNKALNNATEATTQE